LAPAAIRTGFSIQCAATAIRAAAKPAISSADRIGAHRQRLRVDEGLRPSVPVVSPEPRGASETPPLHHDCRGSEILERDLLDRPHSERIRRALHTLRRRLGAGTVAGPTHVDEGARLQGRTVRHVVRRGAHSVRT